MTEVKDAPAEYLERHIFPLLLPGIEETLKVAKMTERRKRFNPLDYLSAYLYRHNPGCSGREDIPFKDIPFVKEEWAKNPRPLLPLSATLTEEEAAVIIQSYYRGYLVRQGAKVQLFRTWQRKVQQEREAVTKIQQYWRKRSATKRVALQQSLALGMKVPTTTVTVQEHGVSESER